jgi:hypothetical protein
MMPIFIGDDGLGAWAKPDCGAAPIHNASVSRITRLFWNERQINLRNATVAITVSPFAVQIPKRFERFKSF